MTANRQTTYAWSLRMTASLKSMRARSCRAGPLDALNLDEHAHRSVPNVVDAEAAEPRLLSAPDPACLQAALKTLRQRPREFAARLAADQRVGPLAVEENGDEHVSAADKVRALAVDGSRVVVAGHFVSVARLRHPELLIQLVLKVELLLLLVVVSDSTVAAAMPRVHTQREWLLQYGAPALQWIRQPNRRHNPTL